MTPINLPALEPFLTTHPDQAYANFIRQGLSQGFRIGYSTATNKLISRRKNHPSSQEQAAAVDERILSELTAGRLFGPLPPPQNVLVHVSPLGVVPKPHQPDKWRMITDLSCPRSSSVNDGISPDLCSLRYASVDDAISIVRRLGSKTLLIKLDIKDAYRIVPVHPADYHLLGISWRDQVYIDRALPFGLRSAPKLFNAVADFVAWVLVKQGVNHLLHYLDDFLLLVPPHSNQGEVVLRCALQTLKALGIPVAVHKTQGPTPSLVFLGILIDTHTFELRLPSDKLTRLQTLLQTWVGRTSCTKHDLESLFGHLSHAATVIVQGRTFLRHLFPLLTVNRPKHLPIRLNNGAKAEIAVVADFPTRMEWSILLSGYIHSWGGDIRCLWHIRLWRLLRQSWLVPVGLAPKLASYPHHRQGVSSHRYCSSAVGSYVAAKMRAF